MTNFEKWKDKIFAIISDNDEVAFNDGVPCHCSALICIECDFHGMCNKRRYEWLYAEYVEPKVDWSKVQIDTKILVRDRETEPWVRGHFAGVNEDGRVLAFEDGKSSWTGEGLAPIWWKYAKLAEED